jgi:hypothetical protein
MLVVVIYGGDHTTQTIENVPSTCTIADLRSAIAKMNHLDRSDSIRIVFDGRVLFDIQQLQDLAPADEITLYVTGVPSHVHPRQRATAHRPLASYIPRSGWQLLVPLVLLVAVVISLVSYLNGTIFDVHQSSQFLSIISEQFLIVVSFLTVGLAYLGSLVWTEKTTWETVAECGKLFVLSFFPNWDAEGFKRQYQGTS